MLIGLTSIEQNTWVAVCSVLLGVLFGIVVNVATGGVMTQVAWAIIIGGGLLAVVTGWIALRYSRRANKLKEHYLGQYGSGQAPGDVHTKGKS